MAVAALPESTVDVVAWFVSSDRDYGFLVGGRDRDFWFVWWGWQLLSLEVVMTVTAHFVCCSSFVVGSSIVIPCSSELAATFAAFFVGDSGIICSLIH